MIPSLLAAALLLTAFFIAQASPAPTSAPTPAATAAASAAPSATPTYGFVYRPTPSPVTTPFPGPNAPQIDEIDLNEATIVTPGALRVRVLTSDPVVSVMAQTFGRSIVIPQRQRGIFTLDATIPAVPDFLRNRTYDVLFVATGGDGRSSSVTLALTLK